MRIDAAGYQEKIIEHCDQKIEYAISEKSSKPVREYINERDEMDEQNRVNRQGEAMEGYSDCRTTPVIGQYENPSTLQYQ